MVDAAVRHSRVEEQMSPADAFAAATRGGHVAAGNRRAGVLAVGRPAALAVWDCSGFEFDDDGLPRLEPGHEPRCLALARRHAAHRRRRGAPGRVARPLAWAQPSKLGGCPQPSPCRRPPAPVSPADDSSRAAWFRYAVALLAGVLTGLSWQPYGLWPLLLIGLPAFTLVVRGVRRRRAFGLGYVYGLAMLGVSISWIHVLGVWIAVAADRVRGALLRPAGPGHQPGVGAAVVAAGRGVLLGR